MRIAIIAPIPTLRLGLGAILTASISAREGVSDFEVVYQAASLSDLLSDRPAIDLLVLSEDAYSLSELHEAIARYEGQFSLLVISEDQDAITRLTGFAPRAWGVLPVDASPEELLAAVGALKEGLWVGTPALIEPLLRPNRSGALQPDDLLTESLTGRETQILELLAHGLANKQIALALDISEHTVKFHLSSIYSKLGVANRAEAVRQGIQRGLVSL